MGLFFSRIAFQQGWRNDFRDGGDQTFQGPKVTPPKMEKSPNFTHYFSKMAQFNKILKYLRKIICSDLQGPKLSGDPTRWTPPKSEVTGFDALFLERGPI